MFLCCFLFVCALLFLPFSCGTRTHHLEDVQNFATAAFCLLVAADPELLGDKNDGRGGGKPHRYRKRKFVNDIFNELGPHYVRRAYRMEPASFWRLVRILQPYMKGGKSKRKAAQKSGAKNGLIPLPSRVSAALRYFAGGAAYDIAVVHGMGHTDVYRSVWKVVDAVNKCPKLDFSYPSDHNEQQKIADDFKELSRGVFSCCGGAADGILVWTERPSEESCESAQCGPKKFFCGRKKKFGLNMQATCDAHRRFLDIYVSHPGSTSDYLAWTSSPLYHKLERKGFMKQGICIFGDNAYVNTPTMATPYKAVGAGTKDAYNYFHSNVRITIECAFGMLTRRWGILMRPFPTSVNIAKVTAVVRCLCRLHNFCINERLARQQETPISQVGSPQEEYMSDMADRLASDEFNIVIGEGGMWQEGAGGGEEFRPEGLLHGGEHFDDISYWSRHSRRNEETLPRERMLDTIQRLGLRRTTPRHWVGKTPARSYKA
ncbi:unknown protein [Seminavis robusta]|uniref:DDE Tnp4 domain-containing protein n=1 Tax=Seminavis robusta TaxID=568900 RepID=A0A9N8ENU5_9STRA|nr:unknown protein [Seminavis robusta]|eukprot:Sro1254_g256391.1  (488) ;mRNA; r:4651-6114